MNKQTRRAFLGTSLATLSASTAFASPQAKSPLIHHVFFWLKNPASKDDLTKLLEGIKSLQKIEAIQEFRIGVPAKTPKREVIDDTYAVSLFTTFKDVAGHNVYQDHAIHKKFVENYSSLWSKVQVYDSVDV
ncbi:DabB protein [Cytophagales bacterium WSM2-2]|nr:DabB protein [Cytophagales bacterium WSM2-2]